MSGMGLRMPAMGLRMLGMGLRMLGMEGVDAGQGRGGDWTFRAGPSGELCRHIPKVRK